jgi:glutamine synthetase
VRLLPQSLHEAIDEFSGNDVIQGALGEIAEDFQKIKSQEWTTYNGQITPWETAEYLTYF